MPLDIKPRTLKAKTVGKFFAAFRKNRDLSQRALAEHLGCASPYIAQVEKDHFEIPIQICRKLARLLDEEEKEHLLEILRASITL